MKTFLTIIYIFSALIPTGNCLLCVECTSHNSSSCDGSLITCSSCLTVFTQVKNGNFSSSTIAKACNIIPELFNVTYSVTAGTAHLELISFLCDADLCNNSTVEAPVQDTTENGMECPSCFKKGTESCETNESMKCTGAETKCIHLIGKIYYGGNCIEAALRGCATENVCNSPNVPLYPVTQLCEAKHHHCSEGKSTPATA